MNLKLLEIIENNHRMAELCSLHALWKNMQLPAGIPTLEVKREWSKGVRLNSEHMGEIVHVGDEHILIKSNKDRALFYGTARAMEGELFHYRLNDCVRFLPEKGQGKYGDATNITKR